MSRFPLAGLLRLRRIEQDKSAADMAQAQRSVESVKVRRITEMSNLSHGASHPADAVSLLAVAASRAATFSTLADLQGVLDAEERDLTMKQGQFTEARTRTVSLEKMESRHTADAVAEELRIEQNDLDETASNLSRRAATATTNS